MNISMSEVDKVAVLARLVLTEDERELFSCQLSAILDYFEKLKEVDTVKAKPMTHVTGVSNIVRPDRVDSSLPKEDFLANAPDEKAGCFRVPRIIV